MKYYVINKKELYHYGIPRRSGRYPYGSGERPFQSSGTRRIKNYETTNQSMAKAVSVETIYDKKIG